MPAKPLTPPRTGRPSAYRAEFAEQGRKLCLLGATDKEIGDFFGVTERTVNRWKKEHEDFCQSLKSGKAKADALVAHALYHRALGYKHDAVKIITVSDGGNAGSHVEEVPYVEHYPPDSTACIFWLKNRRPDEWRDRQAMELSGQVASSGVLAVPVAPDAAQWAAGAAAQQAALAARPAIAPSSEP